MYGYILYLKKFKSSVMLINQILLIAIYNYFIIVIIKHIQLIFLHNYSFNFIKTFNKQINMLSIVWILLKLKLENIGKDRFIVYDLNNYSIFYLHKKYS
jgi:hypothetical protein